MMFLYYSFFTVVLVLAVVVWVRLLVLSSQISATKSADKEIAGKFKNIDTFLLSSNPGFPLLSLVRLLPGTFVGLGILGTFLGFSDGITKLDLSREDPTEFLNHLDVFFNGLKTAFGTSIAGVILSVLFGTILYQWPLNTINFHCTRLYNEVKEEINLAEGAKSEFNGYVTSIREMTETLLTAKKSIEVLPDRFLDVGKSLEESIGPVKETFAAMQSTLENYAVQAKALQGASEQIQQSLTKFIETAGETTGRVNAVLEQTITATKDIQDNNTKLNSDHAKMLEDYKNLHADMDESYKKLLENYKKLYKWLSDVQIKMKDDVASYGVEIKNHFSQLLTEYSERSREIIQSQNVQLLEERRTVLEDYKQIDESISSIMESINKNISDYSSVIEKSLVHTLEEYNNTARKVTESFFGGHK